MLREITFLNICFSLQAVCRVAWAQGSVAIALPGLSMASPMASGVVAALAMALPWLWPNSILRNFAPTALDVFNQSTMRFGIAGQTEEEGEAKVRAMLEAGLGSCEHLLGSFSWTYM